MIAEFIGAENLPIESCLSPHLRDLLDKVYCLGVKTKYGGKDIKDFQMYLDDQHIEMNPKRVRDCIINVAGEKRNKGLQPFKNMKLCSVSIDGIALYDKKFLNFDVLNTTLERPPITVAIRVMTVNTTEKFVEVFSEVFTILESEGIEIASVISDGLPSQVAALNYLNPESLQSLFPENFGKIIFVPCMAHKFNNIIKFVYRENHSFNRLLTHARALAVFLRKSSFRGNNLRKCPLYVETRWAYDSDVISFLLSYQDAIESWLDENDSSIQFPKNLVIIADILSEKKQSITSFESTNL
jgi:hypothetical protein